MSARPVDPVPIFRGLVYRVTGPLVRQPVPRRRLMRSLNLTGNLWNELHAYLQHETERMAFLAAVPAAIGRDDAGDSGGTGDAWEVVDVMYLDDDRDYSYQGSAGVELADDIRPRTLKWATSLDAALIEVHTHGPGRFPTTFSITDLRGLREAVPGLIWRLDGRPYAAIVVGGRQDHDSLTWASKDTPPTPIGHLVIDDNSQHPTGLAGTRIATLEDTP